MSYAILRVAKLKSFGEIGGSLAHTFRERPTPNAAAELKQANEHLGASTAAEALSAIRCLLPEKRRSDAVLCIEYFVGRSPTWTGDDDRYFAHAVEWLVERHGRENVVSAHIHRDETTPHLVAYVVPLDGDRLNAKKWLGGKAVLSAMQTDFWQSVARQHSLKRGEEGSVAQHQSVKQYYARVQRAEQIARVDYPMAREATGLLTKEGDPEFAHRVARAVHDQMIGDFSRGQQAPGIAARERQQAREVSRLKGELAAARAGLHQFEALFVGLGEAQRERLFAATSRLAERMRAAGRAVVGWLKDALPDREEATLTLLESDTGRTVSVTAPRAVADLKRAGAEPGDLVLVGTSGGTIIERSRGRDGVAR